MMNQLAEDIFEEDECDEFDEDEDRFWQRIAGFFLLLTATITFLFISYKLMVIIVFKLYEGAKKKVSSEAQTVYCALDEKEEGETDSDTEVELYARTVNF